MRLSRDDASRIAEYLAARKVLIADAAAPIRSNLSRMLGHLGTSSVNIYGAKTISEAQSVLAKVKPEIVLTEFTIGQESGMALLMKLKEIYHDPTERLFIVVTANSEQSSVVEAAEEEVDSYIVKPFNAETLEDQLQMKILRKIKPSPYDHAIQKGRKLLLDGRYVEALAAFTGAKEHSRAPALACYYSGKTLESLKRTEEALKQYETGLSHNVIHYKCLIGITSAYEKLGRTAEAYKQIRDLVRFFPASPGRLANIFELAVQTKNFQDLDIYYEVFLNMDYRPDELVRTVAASLVIAGKFYIQKNELPKALAEMKKATISSGRQFLILKKIVLILVENAMVNESAEFLKMVSDEDRETVDFKELDLMIKDRLDKPEIVAEEGRRLIYAGTRTREIFIITCKRMHEVGKTTLAKEIAEDAVIAFPDLKEPMESYLK